MSAPRRGLVQVYTGTGKGKTTAALGQTWRALGAGLRVVFIQFLKGGLVPSEQRLAGHFSPQLTFRNFGHPPSQELYRGELTAEDRQLVQQAWALAREALADPQVDLVVLDEINNALHLGVLSPEELLTALRSRPASQEVVCTGRRAPDELTAFADLVTEMREVKHPYSEGVTARFGIEI